MDVNLNLEITNSDVGLFSGKNIGSSDHWSNLEVWSTGSESQSENINYQFCV